MMRGDAAGTLDRILATLEEAGSSLWRRRPFVAATVGAIAVTLAFPAMVVLALARGAEGVDALRARERVRAFMSQDATPGQAAAVAQAFRAAEGIERVEEVSPEAARAAFLQGFPELSGAVAAMSADELGLPASVEASGTAEPLSMASLARRVSGMPGVDEVRYDAASAQGLDALARRLRGAAWTAALLSLVATGFGIGNVIRMGALARREQLAVMRLVGAPRLHLRMPFIIEGLVQGALGGVVAGALVAASARVLSGALTAVPPEVAQLPARGWLALVVAPAAVGALAAWISVEAVLRRHAQLER